MSDNNRNTIQLLENGPLYFRGIIEVQNSDGETVLQKEKVALCRCGQSGKKPACDGTHNKVGFKAGLSAELSDVPASEVPEQDKLVVKTMKNGPILVEGCYTLTSDEIGEHTSKKTVAFCRCGASSNKPFCDGSHKKVEFKAI